MYVLHFAPDTASLIIRLTLDGAGIPYRPAPVDRAGRQLESPAYRALNPAGLIPVLETPQGPIAETGAILLWLADSHRLGPAPQDPDRQPFLQWLFFLSNTAHADLRTIFYPHQYAPSETHAAHHEIMATRMLRHFGLIEAAVTRHPTLFAPARPLGVYALALTRWAALYPPDARPWFALPDFPALEALARAQEARVETRVLARAEGLGPAPFTQPQLPTPPAGAAR